MLKVSETGQFPVAPPMLTNADTTTKTFKWSWRYNSAVDSSRDVRLDFLRGLCLLVMTVDHIGFFGPDSWLYALTARGDFYISAAEGFVLISGLVMGLVYGRIIRRDGMRPALSKLIQRIFKIYTLAVGLSLFFVAIAKFTDLQIWAERDWIEIKDPIELVVSILTLHFAYHGASILVMYVIFLALAPLVFYLLVEGKTWAVLAVSWAVWLGYNLYPDQFSLPFASNFPLPAWQFLFVNGIVIGYHRNTLLGLINKYLGRWYSIGMVAASVSLVALFLVGPMTLLETLLPGSDFAWLSKDLHEKGALPPVRMLAIWTFFQGLYVITTWAWKPLNQAVGWLLVPLGEVALYVFAMHLVAIDIFYNIPGSRDLPYWLYGFALLAPVLLLWAMVKTKFLFKIIPH